VGASEYHELVSVGGPAPPKRPKQKAGQIGRSADLGGLSARRVRDMDIPNHIFCGSIKKPFFIFPAFIETGNAYKQTGEIR